MNAYYIILWYKQCLGSSLFSSSQLLHSTQLVSTQHFSALYTSLLMSGCLTPAYLSSSQVFSVLLMSSALLTTVLSSSQLMPTLLWPKACSKPDGSRRQSHKKSTMLTAFERQNYKENGTPPKARKKHQKLIVATLAQPFRCDFQAQTVAKDGTTCSTATLSNIDAATPVRLQAASWKTP